MEMSLSQRFGGGESAEKTLSAGVEVLHSRHTSGEIHHPAPSGHPSTKLRNHPSKGGEFIADTTTNIVPLPWRGGRRSLTGWSILL
jgi:hypothetical protein